METTTPRRRREDSVETSRGGYDANHRRRRIARLRYHAGAAALVRLRVDDAVNAGPVHYGAGLWGLLAPGFLAAPKNVRAVYGADRGGVFYDGDARILACNLAAACSITLWVVLTMGPYFYMLSKYGYLRVSMDKEIDGPPPERR